MIRALAIVLILATAAALSGHEGRPRYADEPEGLLFVTMQDSAGSDSMSIVSTLVDPGHFYYKVPAGKTLRVERLNLGILDDVMTPAKFGGLTALTNGLLLQIVDTDSTTVLLDFTADIPITANWQWTVLAGVDNHIDLAAGEDQWSVRWTLSKAGEDLHLRSGQFIRIVTRDNLSGLSSFIAMLQGVFEL